MDNETAIFNNWTEFSIDNEKIYHISIVSHIINIAISFLTVILNSIVLSFIRGHRKEISDVIFKQILCLSVTDLFAGFAPALFTLTLIETVYQSAVACLVIINLFFVAQAAVLLNICILSIRRWIVLRNVTKPKSQSTRNPTSAKVFNICPWLISLLCFAPLLLIRIHSSESSTINGCFSLELFENPKRFTAAGLVYLSALFLITMFNIRSIIALKHVQKSNISHFRGRGQSLQRKAFKHLLAVLFVTNVTTLPNVAVMVIMNTQVTRNPDLMFILVQLQALKSLLNPILCCTQMREIKTASKENTGSFLRRFGGMFGRNKKQ